MSSTGLVFLPQVAANLFGEAQRKLQGDQSGHPGASEGVRLAIGQIVAISQDNLSVKVSTVDPVTEIAGGKPIRLAHTSQDIVSRFGTIRRGMMCAVFYTDVAAGDAVAYIIGNEGELPERTPWQPNTVVLGPYRIFAPGMGL